MKPGLRPFWYYFGAKAGKAARYPAPVHRTIIEPFAGGAGYSLRYYDRDVVLVERNPRVAAAWAFLIAAAPRDIRALPLVNRQEDIPASLPIGARTLIQLNFGHATGGIQTKVTTRLVQQRAEGHFYRGWTDEMRERCALQVPAIRHWRMIEGDYTLAPDVEATWFVDPPYSNAAGRAYEFGSDKIDFAALGAWCRARQGRVIVCENAGATWLPFQALYRVNNPCHKAPPSTEAVWLATNPPRASTGL